MKFVYFFPLLAISLAFECFTCNDGPLDDDDTKPCEEMKSVCPEGVTTCSTLITRKGKTTLMRKFCSTRNTRMLQYPQLVPRSSFCEDVDTKGMSLPPRQSAGSSRNSTSLLCVCSTPLCNEGNFKKIVERTMMSNIPRRRVHRLEEPLPPSPESQPANDLMLQMTDAGF